MKKIIVLLLTGIILLSTFSGCNKDLKNDLKKDAWDGSVASSFEGGSGTKSDPYKIADASQLAFLAKSVNEGTSYSGKYVVLTEDIDLNNVEWTPIGNGIQVFMGNFDGKGRTIKNLKISQGIHYSYEIAMGRKVQCCDFGLFATVHDASIQNLRIDGAKIKTTDARGVETYQIGVLCGSVKTYQNICTISNIQIKNATITADFSTKSTPEPLRIGGTIGYVYAYNNTSTIVSLIETDTAISLASSLSPRNYTGTILGGVSINDSTFTLENCVAYQTLDPNPYQYYFGASYDFSGAIGMAQASTHPFTIKNVFSKLTINKPILEGNKYFDAEITAHAIIGDAYYPYNDDLNAKGYIFENVFGCVETIDLATNEKKVETSLYKLPEGTDFSQINCEGCEKLPENHGFDENLWNLEDLEKPKLK